jgi:hypothetical protein
MADDPSSAEHARGGDTGEPAEGDLLLLTSTAAHQLAQLRSTMSHSVQLPPASTPELAGAREALRRAVMAYVRRLRGSGVSPAQTILRVKSAVEPELTLPTYERRECVDDVVRWTIKAYYDA